MSYTIPQIPVTALSILIDDFLELGGVSGGSRKFLASTFVLTTDPRLSALGTVTSVSASGGATGLSFTGSPITETGTLLLAGTLAPTSGGTGNTTYAVGDLIQASSSTALARLAAVAAGNVLLSGGVNTVSSWGKVGIGTHVSGLGTGIAAALAVSTGSAGAPVLFDGALGTPTGGNASNLTALNATQLTSGTVPDNRFPGTLPAVSGANLTALNATQLTSGTVPDGRFPATLPTTSGANLTALNASQLTSGTVSNARTTATSANTINTIVARDGSGNFAAGVGTFTALTAANALRATSNATTDTPSSALDYIAGKARVWSWGPDASTLGTFAVRLARSDGSTALAPADEPLTVTATGTTIVGTLSASGQITGNLTGTVTGNAATATQLLNPRTIAITGDLAYTSPNFDGTGNVTAAGTLATVATAGTTGSSTAIPVITINAKGLTTSISTAAVVAPAGTLSGTTLAAGVTGSSLTSVGTLAGLTVTAAITGSVTGSSGSTTGNAATATKLITPRAINGVNFDGSADITVTAAAGTLSGTTLAAGVTGSSLTSVGTLAGLTVTTAINGSVTGSSGSTTGNAATATKLITPRAINGVNFDGSADITVTAAANTLSGTTLAAGVTGSSLTSVGTLTGLSTSGQITSSLVTGTAPFSVASTTNVPNLNAGLLNGATADTANTANKIVARDGSGNFAAGTITANLTGTASDVANSAVIAKVLTGYTSGSGAVAATDTILQAIQKLNGNDGNLQPLDAALTALALGSDFVKFTGPTGTVKTFTLPNADAQLVFQGDNATLGIAAITQLKLTPELGYVTAGSITLDLSKSRNRIVLTGNLTVSATSNPSNDASSVLELYNSTAGYLTLAWSQLASWKTNGVLPTAIAPGQTLQFLFQCWGTTESTVSINYINQVDFKQFNVRNYGATGDSSTNDRTAIAAADSAANAARGVLVFPAGTYYVGSSLTLSSSPQFEGGALSIASGQTVTFNQAVVAPVQRIFYGSGVVRMAFRGAKCPVEWWGAGTGTENVQVDDRLFIQAAFEACRNISGDEFAEVIFSRQYWLSDEIIVSSNIGIDTNSASALMSKTTSGTGKGLRIQGPFDANRTWNLPNFSGFTVFALKVDQASTARINIGQISGSGLLGDGIAVGCNVVGASTLDNIFNVNFIAGCKSAIRIYSNVDAVVAPLATIEGNEFNVNFVNDNLNGVVFDSLDNYTLPTGAGVTYTKGSAWDCNIFNLTALDAHAGVRRGFWYRATGLQYSQNVFRVPAWFGGFSSEGIWIDTSAATKSTFELGVRVGEQMASYGQLNLRGSGNTLVINGSGNVFGDTLAPTAYTAVTSSNSRASFNSGDPVPRNRMKVNFVLSGDRAFGDTQTFYIYSPLVDGYSNRLRVSFIDSGGFIVNNLYDNSNVIPNEIVIVFQNASGVTRSSGFTFSAWVEIAY